MRNNGMCDNLRVELNILHCEIGRLRLPNHIVKQAESAVLTLNRTSPQKMVIRSVEEGEWGGPPKISEEKKTGKTEKI